ncbi:MAG: hypothetical protein K2W96_02685 [Gemmataceae bacterium]|nr:hypothetical protein [Gemmataceae bacterium]
MATPGKSPEEQAQVQKLAETLRPLVDDLVRRVASLLVETRDAPFGKPEFDLRRLLHRAGAQAFALSLSQKNTAAGAPAWPAPAAVAAPPSASMAARASPP